MTDALTPRVDSHRCPYEGTIYERDFEPCQTCQAHRIRTLERDLSECRAQLELVDAERSSMFEAATILLPAIGWSSGGLGAAAIEIVAKLTACRAALRELVACKDLKDRIEARDLSDYSIGDTARTQELDDEYQRRKPLAWSVARAILQSDEEEGK